jgi:nucleoside-diphosphate-sugar epimerase
VRVLIAGAHGKTARRLTRILVGEGHEVRGLVRKEEQTGDVASDGAEPVLVDLEAEEVSGGVGRAVEGCDAIVFAAGAGPGSGDARKETMDYGGAVKLIEAAEDRGVRRYLMLSAMGAGDPEGGADGMRPPRQGQGRRAPGAERPRLHHHPSRQPDRGRGHRQHTSRREAGQAG